MEDVSRQWVAINPCRQTSASFQIPAEDSCPNVRWWCSHPLSGGSGFTVCMWPSVCPAVNTNLTCRHTCRIYWAEGASVSSFLLWASTRSFTMCLFQVATNDCFHCRLISWLFSALIDQTFGLKCDRCWKMLISFFVLTSSFVHNTKLFSLLSERSEASDELTGDSDCRRCSALSRRKSQIVLQNRSTWTN